jgi:ABC-type microcin C transport system permease subunit YejB
MTWHWWHITLSYSAVLGGFAALTMLIAARARTARKNLTRLERP